MYLRKVRIQNIRSFDDFTISFDEGKEAGWHVIIGDNGSGKTAMVRAIAIGLIGPVLSNGIRINYLNWLKDQNQQGLIQIELLSDHTNDIVPFDASTLHPDIYIWQPTINAGIKIVPNYQNGGQKFYLQGVLNNKNIDNTFHHFWNFSGWFSASFGPYRRFTGGDKDYVNLFNTNEKLSCHVTAFGEDVALTECLTWLREIYIKKIDHKLDDDYLEELKTFINESGLLPHNTKLYKVDSEAVYFKDGDGCILPVIDLSDGYRSILSMMFEIIRQMILCYGSEKVFHKIRNNVMNIDLPGVILIDEVDTHLHPSWQERIGSWFTKYFPKVQFIVTTHSPLICRAAETGSVWKLSAPGSNEPSRRIMGIELQRLIYGNILEALDTDLFGEDVTRSESSQRKLERIAQLNRKMLQGKLSDAEKKELDDLRTILPTSTDAGLSTK